MARSALQLSTSRGEGWGLCVLEAAALGVPTVAFDVEGLRDAVRDGRTGWLVRDGEQLGDVVERALKELADPVRRAAIGAACRDWASQFSWERTTAQMTTLIWASIQNGTSRGIGGPAGEAGQPAVIHAPALPPGHTQPEAGDPGGAAGDERTRTVIRLVAFCLLLEVLPFVTAPGNIIADTKLDLAADPARFLSRALTLWDPQQFGQLQDQAVGYLFPMGPFFALGKLAALQPWVIQRLWIGAVLVAAFLGTVRLAAGWASARHGRGSAAGLGLRAVARWAHPARRAVRGIPARRDAALDPGPAGRCGPRRQAGARGRPLGRRGRPVRRHQRGARPSRCCCPRSSTS